MKMRPRLAALVAGFGLLLLAVTGAAADELTGGYDARGRNPQGKDYQGVVQIEPLGKLEALFWKLTDGEVYKGIGIRVDDVLGAAYGPANAGFAVAVYKVDGGTLQGVWAETSDPNAELGRETLQGPAGLNGEYKITLGQNRDGMTNYTGKVIIKREGETFVLIKAVSAHPVIGVGVELNNLLIVGYGIRPQSVPGVVAYATGDKDNLTGIWANVGMKATGGNNYSVIAQKKAGVEVLTRRAQ